MYEEKKRKEMKGGREGKRRIGMAGGEGGRDERENCKLKYTSRRAAQVTYMGQTH